MGLIEIQSLVQRLSPPLDTTLADLLVREFVSLERRYILRDWEPAELDGGQFCEILARVLYHLDSGILNLSRSFQDCKQYLENDQVTHQINRGDAKAVLAVLCVVNRFRSTRGAVHISPNYTANHMDARFMVEGVRWAMVETIRIFWSTSREEAAKAIREILKFDVPAIGRFDEQLLVQRTDLRPDEEVLILLHYAGETGFTRNEVGRAARCSAPAVTRALQSLTDSGVRQAIRLDDGRYCLTDLGQKRIREELADKLLLE